MTLQHNENRKKKTKSEHVEKKTAKQTIKLLKNR